MFRNLKLEEYRSFESYELRNLARVNLLVGPNNCGKTSILEAVHFLTSGGNPFVLRQIAGQRGEENPFDSRDSRYASRRVANVWHLVFGDRFDPGSQFRISADDGTNWVHLIVEEDEADLHSRQRPPFEMEADDGQPLAVRITGSGIKEAMVLPAVATGALLLGPRAVRTAGIDASSRRHVRFVTADSLGVDSMKSMWGYLVLERREQEVIDALKLVEPDLESIHFLSGNGYGRDDVVLGRQDSARRTPIGSHGDGTRRLLALALSLTQLSGGVLLIDEIDTGLHWTVLEHLWKLVVEQAAAASIQVFATTHSYDCIRGLAAFVTAHPDLAAEVSVQKVERALDGAVGFDGTDVERAVNHDIELR